MSHLSLNVINSIGVSQFVSRVVDIQIIANTLRSFCSVPSDFTIVVFGLGLLYSLHPHFFWGAIGAILFQSLLAIPSYSGRKKLEQSRASVLGWERQVALEHLNAPHEIQSLDGAVSTRWRWDKIISNRTAVDYRLSRFFAFNEAGSTLSQQGARIALFSIASFLVVGSQVTFGQVMSALFLIGVLADPVDRMVYFVLDWSSVRVYLHRLSFLFDLQEERQQPIFNQNSNGFTLKLENVGFKHSLGASENTLSQISTQIDPGQVVCVLGSSGSGKSTLAQLLNGLKKPTSGTVYLGGVDVQNFSMTELRDKVSLVEHDGHLFSGTIQENITLFDQNPDMRKVVEVARVAGLDEFVLADPSGYSRRLQNLGYGLSQGQKQRILIARALYRSPDILVLDEATSHLDPVTEEQVLKSLLEALKGKTLIIFTQRVNVAMKADRVLYLEAGKLVEQGPHVELVQRRGKYFHFFRKFLSIG